MMSKLFYTWLAMFISIGVACAQANRAFYWKGGSGDFNTAANWWLDSYNSGTTATQSPQSTNDVYFTAAAFSAAGATITVNGDANCKSMNWDNAITAANAPTITSANSINLSIYGSLDMATNLNWQFHGNLLFKSNTSGTVSLRTRGKTLYMGEFVVEVGSATTFLLQDDLTIENYNLATQNTIVDKGLLTFNSGQFNTNGKTVAVDFFKSVSGNTTRLLTATNSTFDITGTAVKQHSWRVDFNATNCAGFASTGSTIRIRNLSNFTNQQYLAFGSLPYDMISIEHQHTRIYINSQTVYANVFNVAAGCIPLLLNGTTINTNEFRIGAGASVVAMSATSRIITNVLTSPTGCQTASLLTEEGTFYLQKKTAGNLIFTNMLLSGITGDVTGGSTYTANNSVNGNSNTNITINALSGCPTALWFRGSATSTDWHTLSNWRTTAGGTVIPTSLPSAATDVYFDANSFVSTPTLDVTLNAPGFCRNMTWTGTPAGARINLFSNTQSSSLFVGGNVTLAANMGGVAGGTAGHELGRGLILYGASKTLTPNNVPFSTALYFLRGSDYTIANDFTGNSMYQYQGSTIRTQNINVTLTSYYTMSYRHLDNTDFYFTGVGWNAISEQDSTTVNYTNGSTFYFNGTGSQMVHGTLPNVVVNNSYFFINYYLGVHGNLTFNVDCQTSMQQHGQSNGGKQLVVWNDLNIGAGNEVVFRDAATSNNIIIGGNLNAIGTCTNPTTIRTYNGTPIPIHINGTSNIQYAYLQGLNSFSPITATNSIDGGNNTNITFTSGSGVTYYWRADRTNSTDFVGDWTNPNHWTTNPASTVGAGACVPTLADNVVFDALSFSGTSNGCAIDGNAYCNNFTCTAGIRIQNPTSGVGKLFVKGNFILHSAITWAHTGFINMVGNGNINTAGKTLNISEFIFNNPTGTWTLQNHLTVDWSSANSTTYGNMRLIAGTFNTNNYNVRVGNRFEASGTSPRSLILGNSVWSMSMNGNYRYLYTTYYYPWNIDVATNMTVSGGTIRFEDGTYAPDGKRLYMGDGLTYNRVEIIDNDENIQIFGSSSYTYAYLSSSLYVDDDNTFDELYLDGGYTYKFKAGKTQTLTAPNGRITSGGSSNSFVLIESASAGSISTFYKPYGSAFCVDFIKVKDMNGTKMALASVPTAYQATHPFLEFQTGTNSDNVNGTATGIWAFNLQPLVSPLYAGTTTLALCTHSSPYSIPVAITGTSPYLIQYSWNDGSSSGSNSVTVSDNDNNPATPFIYPLSMASASASVSYTFNITTSRCGNQTVPTPRTVTITRPTAAALVSVNRTATCTFNNEAVWHTMIDNTDKKPVVALLDQVNVSDVSALGSTTANVYFDGTQQYYNYLGVNYPYLKRHWKITPTNNGAARVRLFFTQAELNALTPFTYLGRYGGTLNPATNIQVFKFASGTIGVGGHTVVSHTVVPVTGSVATPFSATSGIIAIEFDVTSFSHFIIVPNQSALLPLHLLSFDAKTVDNKAVRVDWTTAEDEDVRMYYVERSLNAIEGEIVGNVAPLNVRQETDYQLIDNNPYQGVSYYRVKAVKTDGSFTVSDWKAVTIEKGNDVAVYPNPANDAINLEIRADIQVANVRIIDVLGRVVYSAQWAAANGAIFSIPTQQLESGSYLIQVTDDANFSKQKRITIQH